MTNPPTFRVETFVPYQSPEQSWYQFLLWWKSRWPDCPLPCAYGLYNLTELTGLTRWQVDSLLRQETPESMLPDTAFANQFRA